MILLEKILKEKERELKGIIDRIHETDTADKVEGSLRISRNRRETAYYQYVPSEKEKYPLGKYIAKKEIGLAKKLAQKDYEKKVLKWAAKCHELVTNLLQNYQDNYLNQLYLNMIPERQKLISPIEQTAENFAEAWKNCPYAGKEFWENESCIITNNGERVRSKSEKILADIFLRRKIPYKYESPVYLKGFGTVYPDFTLLNLKTREEIYWEHMGMMDDPEYCNKAIAKVDKYVQNGIILGKHLLLSFETKKHPINTKNVEKILDEMFGGF